MAISGVRFGHVAFRVADVERALRWYGDAFGARRVLHAPEDGGRQELMFLEFAKGQYIEIFTHGTDRVATPSAMIGYQHFCLVVDDINQALAHLAAMNVLPQRPVREGRPHYLITFIADPDDNVIELMQITPQSAIYRE
jgi:catechol 2,3-dioxygenase-like lactoylglutathione lyase family enzyme